MGHAAGNMVGTAAGSIANGIGDLANGTKNMAGNMTRDDNNTNTNNDTIDNLGMQEESNYSATRTATSTNNNNLLGLSSNAWLWIIMGIVGAIIVGLVWYYGAQYENKSYDHNR